MREEQLAKIVIIEDDLSLLDLSVPYLDGFEMIEALHADPATRNVPVIVLTGRGDDDTYAQARRLGAARVLTKPVARDLLMKAIDGQLNSSKPLSGKK